MKNEGKIDFRATTRVAPTKRLRTRKTLRATSLHAPYGRFSSSPPHWGGFRWGLLSSTAQFMQADIYIQTPEDYIGYNRYSYCLYNPFKYTDPSGEYWVYQDPAFLNEVPAGTQGAMRYWVEEKNLMLEEELARLNAWLNTPECIRAPWAIIPGMPSDGGSGGSYYGSYGTRSISTTSKKKAGDGNQNQSDSDPSSWNKNFMWTNYIGWMDAKNYDGTQDFLIAPVNMADYYARIHDLEYTNIGFWTKKRTGRLGFLLDTRTIAADYEFTRDELKVALSLKKVPMHVRFTAAVSAYIIGGCAIPKTLVQFMKPNSIFEIIMYNNIGKTHIPRKK